MDIPIKPSPCPFSSFFVFIIIIYLFVVKNSNEGLETSPQDYELMLYDTIYIIYKIYEIYIYIYTHSYKQLYLQISFHMSTLTFFKENLFTVSVALL